MAMDYMTLFRNGYPASGEYNMQNFSNNHHPHGHQGYPYRYTNDELYMMAQLQHHRTMMSPVNMAAVKGTEPKPRLSKDEVDFLEREFRKNPKPSTGRKREIAEMLKVDNPRINNWFQNRRAKEKQIKKSQAQQAMERSSTDSSDDQDQAEADDAGSSRALHVSSAAFPSKADSTDDDSQDVLPEHDEDDLTHGLPPSAEEDFGSYPKDDYLSPKSIPFPSTEHCEFDLTPLAHGFLPSQMANDTTEHHSHGSCQDDEANTRQSPDMRAYSHFQQTSAIDHDSIIAPAPAFPSQLIGINTVIHGMKSEYGAESHETVGDGSHGEDFRLEAQDQSPQDSPDLRFKSPPPPSNIAGRRNKGVPAQLNPTALRSYSYGPKTGLDMGKRPDAPSPIRRIASATGFLPGRIQKSAMGSAPRSPMYLDRTKEALMRSLQGARSPVLGSLNTALSPVTPSEQATREATVLSSASDDEQRYTFGNSHNSFFRLDSTLKTPPTTPGLSRAFSDNNVLSIDTAWHYMPNDEPLVTPGLGSYGSEEFSMAQSAPGYVANSSQPATPSYGVGSSYGFPWCTSGNAPSSNAEYTFPADSYIPGDVSGKSSPGQLKARHFQFTQNITPQDFSIEKS